MRHCRWLLVAVSVMSGMKLSTTYTYNFPRVPTMSTRLPSQYEKNRRKASFKVVGDTVAASRSPLSPFRVPFLFKKNELAKLECVVDLLERLSDCDYSRDVVIRKNDGVLNDVDFYNLFQLLSYLWEGTNGAPVDFHNCDNGFFISLPASPPPAAGDYSGTDTPESVTADTQSWVKTKLVEMNICPFTSSPMVSSTGLKNVTPGKILYGSTFSSCSLSVIASQLAIIHQMVAAGDSGGVTHGVSSILHSSPAYDEDFDSWLVPFQALPGFLALVGLEKTLCVVCFHPKYRLPTGFSGFGHMHTLQKLMGWVKVKHPDSREEDIARSGEWQRQTKHATLNVLWAEHMEEAEKKRDSQELYTYNYERFMEEQQRGHADAAEDATLQPVANVLCLHGSGGSGEKMKQILEPTFSSLLGESFAFSYLTAPHLAGWESDSFVWWNLPPGVRSSTADEYGGYDLSLGVLREGLIKVKPKILIGHSQVGEMESIVETFVHAYIPLLTLPVLPSLFCSLVGGNFHCFDSRDVSKCIKRCRSDRSQWTGELQALPFYRKHPGRGFRIGTASSCNCGGK